MRKVRVLVVDDSRVSHVMMDNILSKTEFEICGYAKNAAEAVDLYRKLQPDLVTMDMNLPDADGMECSRRILQINANAPIVMISAMRDASLMVQGRAVGIGSFLQKPVDAHELLETLRMTVALDEDKLAALQTLYVRPFVQSLKKNLFSLAGLHCKATIELDHADFIEVNGIAVIIGLTGSTMGRLVLHMDKGMMTEFSRVVLGLKDGEELTDEKISDSIEEASNIIAGRGVSLINDAFKDKELRITPPGTIFGNKIRIVNPRLTSFHVGVNTRLGVVKMNIGFARGE